MTLSKSKELLAAKNAIKAARRDEETVPEDAYDTRWLEVKLDKELQKIHAEWMNQITERIKSG